MLALGLADYVPRTPGQPADGDQEAVEAVDARINITGDLNDDTLQKIKDYRGIRYNLSEVSDLLDRENFDGPGASLHAVQASLALERKKRKFVGARAVA